MSGSGSGEGDPAGFSGNEALVAAESADAAAEVAVRDVEDLLAESATARGRQANLTFFAFTATPKHKTLAPRPLSIRPGPSGTSRSTCTRCVRRSKEGFILDVLANYTTYATYYRLANGLGGEDPELPKGKAAVALARWVSLHPTNIAQRAEVIVEHFRHHMRWPK